MGFYPLGIIGATLMAFLPSQAKAAKMVGNYLTNMVPGLSSAAFEKEIRAENDSNTAHLHHCSCKWYVPCLENRKMTTDQSVSGHTKKITVNAMVLM
jgi:hypothetical protein